MLDIGFFQKVVVDLTLQRRIKVLFLDLRVDLEFGADFFGDLRLAVRAAGFLEFLEQGLDRAVVGGENMRDRKSVVEGKSVSVRVDFGGRRLIKKKNTKTEIKN